MVPARALRCSQPPLGLQAPDLLVPGPCWVTQLVGTDALEGRKVADSYAPSDIADYLKDAVVFYGIKKRYLIGLYCPSGRNQ